MMIHRVVYLAVSLVVFAAQASAEADEFKTAFSNCSEFAGEGPVSLAVAKKLVPAGYTLTGETSGQASIVVRITDCGSVKVGDHPALPTTLSQIGINVVSPDGTGTINNYMLLYVSNNRYLVDAFLHSGMPAHWDATITYQYTLNSAADAGTLYGAVPDGGVPAYFIYGPETEPPANSPTLFIANWWYGPYGEIRQQTTFPAISFGTSSVSLYTNRHSELGRLINGNSDSNFSQLSVRGEYFTAEMIVTH